jgi:hypothetical protein
MNMKSETPVIRIFLQEAKKINRWNEDQIASAFLDAAQL